MATAVKTYISAFLPKGTYVGIVSFESVATKLQDITQIQDDSDRNRVISQVPTVADGGTSIGGGLQVCQQVRALYTNCIIFMIMFVFIL